MTRRRAWAVLIASLVLVGFGPLAVRHHANVVTAASVAPLKNYDHREAQDFIHEIRAATTTTTTQLPPSTTTTTTKHAATNKTSRVEVRPRATILTKTSIQSDNSLLNWEGPPGDCNPRVSHRFKADSDHCWSGLVAHWSDWDQGHMLWILWCESSGNQDARNPSGAHGLFQDMNGPMDPWNNAVVAHAKWKSGASGPWVSSKGCWGGH